MNQMKYIILALFIVICSCHGCILENIDEIEFGVKCQDVSYILDNGEYCLHTACDEYDLYMDEGHCPVDFDCIQNPNGEFFCGNECEKGYHEYQPEGQDYAVCEEDSTENCGVHGNNCLKKEGWRNGTCEDGNCKLIECRGAYQPVDNECKSLRQCYGPNCKDCTLVAGYVCSDDDCVESKCKTSNEILCDGICFDPTSNVSYCGSDDHCEPHECRSDQVCIDSECDCKDHADECEGECKDHDTDLKHCGECNHDCLQSEGWLDGICSEGKCIAQACQEGYHTEEAEEGISVCVEDSPEACGSTDNNCMTYIPGWQDGQCVQTECIVEECQNGYFIQLDEDDSALNSCIENSDDHCGSMDKQCADDHFCNTELGFCACEGELYECEDGLCYDIQTDPLNCGACSHICHRENATEDCVEGQCVFECHEDYIECDDECFEINDVQHCGTCDNACTTDVEHAHPICESQTCGYDCDTGFENCSGSCYDLTSDPKHCNSCDNPCKVPANGDATCITSRCGIECHTGYTNCSENCVDLKTDNNNCGACDNVCKKPSNGSVKCTNSKCVISCNSGFTNCSNQCVDMTKDLNNCGACGNKCAVANATNDCSAGKCTFKCKDNYVITTDKKGCEPFVCTAGDIRCDDVKYQICKNNKWETTQNCTTSIANAAAVCSPSSGCSWKCKSGYSACSGSCFNLTNDANNCGACGNKCSAPSHGSATCSSSKCGIKCDSGYTNCSGKCLNLTNDANNCGACGNKCSAPTHGSATCSSSKCGIKCDSGYTNCSGKCLNLTNDVNNCGACGNKCPTPANGTATCSDSKCGVKCDSGYTNCSGTCVNITNNVNNCGACGNKCSAPSHGSATCSSSKCGIKCDSGYTNCSGACVNLTSNVNNCGACGNKCSAPSNGSATCSSSKCGISCNSGYTNCSGACVNLTSNVNNCGGCGNKCPAPSNGSATCSSSKCGISCNSGYTNCAGSCLNLTNNVNNCGGCGNKCPAPSNGSATCSSSKCGISCNSGYTNCSGACLNLTNNVNNCGTCGNKCPNPTYGSSTCSSGSCVLSCNTNYVNCNNDCIYYTLTGIMNTNTSIYSTPSYSYPLGLAFNYNFVEWIYGEYNGFYAVYTGSQKGYVPASAVYILPAYGYPWDSKGVNVRSGPGKSYSKLGAIGQNTTITITGYTDGEPLTEGGGWYSISSPFVGYVASYYVTMYAGSSASSLPSCP
ncbi:MAG: SH3 domain-containing protein [Proteobacteria bacterium]|nr:SH3 domain-containing protein [Pseudomonadota bacterium]